MTASTAANSPGVITETARLRLREVTLGDALFVIEVLNDPGFLANIGDRSVRTIADAEKYITARIHSSYEKHGWGFYIAELKETREGIGIAGLVKRDQLEVPDIGFAVLAQFCRCGYGWEAAEAVMRYARETLRLPEIAGVTRPENAGSRRVLEKLGLRAERQIVMPDFAGEWILFR